MIVQMNTIYYSIVVISVSIACSLYFSAWELKNGGLRFLAYSFFVQALSYLLMAYGGFLPDSITERVPDALMSLVFMFGIIAVLSFHEKRVSPVLLIIPPFLVVMFGTMLIARTPQRVVFNSVVTFVQGLWMLGIMLGNSRRTVGKGKYLVMSGVIIFILILCVRCLAIVAGTGGSSGEMTVRSGIIIFSTIMVGLIIYSFGFILMTLEKTEENNRIMSSIDRLTGCWNRSRIEEAAKKEMSLFIRSGIPVSMILLDIDYFKNVNDRYGHGTGDRVLKKFADVVRLCVRDTDVLGRWGGEEFIIILPGTGSVGAAELAERIRFTITATPFGNGRDLPLTASLGFSTVVIRDTFEKWINRTDAAMYGAKRNGRNRIETTYGFSWGKKRTCVTGGHFQITWDNRMMTGARDIDKEHAALVRKANRLLRYRDTDDRTRANADITGYVDSLNDHFASEERNVAMTRVPYAAQCTRLRRELSDRMAALNDLYLNNQLRQSDFIECVVFEVTVFHIIHCDLPMFRKDGSAGTVNCM
jgi:diguanylate cyclase (GGDEF)-like protein